jgi:hypothetical protein
VKLRLAAAANLTNSLFRRVPRVRVVLGRGLTPTANEILDVAEIRHCRPLPTPRRTLSADWSPIPLFISHYTALRSSFRELM